MMRWLRFRLQAPMASFGGPVIDARGITADFPTQSMLTGLFANALGWTRGMRREHQALQERLVFGALRENEPVLGPVTDYQTAHIGKGDTAWTTGGEPARRAGGAGTYAGAHQRWRDYHADLRVSGVARLDPVDESPTLEELASALDRPARPLFIGRKACLPAARIFAGWVDDAPDVRSALHMIAPDGAVRLRALWPASEGVDGSSRTTAVTDERNWMSGLHGGSRRVCEGELSAPEADA